METKNILLKNINKETYKNFRIFCIENELSVSEAFEILVNVIQGEDVKASLEKLNPSSEN